ncbi:glycoside hydrolase family 2 protein [gut metagenome]|uniref:Glycoside hydrolase family 2 protein n=1 Tax=gut metagenome TaxID=749906 RepID=J9GF79_9ZZZZ
MKKRIQQHPRWKVRPGGWGLVLLLVLWAPAHALQSRVAGPDNPVCNRVAEPVYTLCNRVADSAVMENQCASTRRSEKAVPSAPWVYWGCQDSTMTAEGLSNRLRTLWRLGVGGLCLPAPSVEVPSRVPGSSSAAGLSTYPVASRRTSSSPSVVGGVFGADSEASQRALTHGLREAARLGLSCAIRLPMGTPMPQVMWSDTLLTGDVSLRNYRLSLPPDAGADYRDIAVYAIPQSEASVYVHPDSCLQLPLYQGKLTARLPEGVWRILRMGYGHPKEGSVGEGEAASSLLQRTGAGPAWDRFDDRVVRQQFAEWWKTCLQQMEAPVVAQVLKRLYVDSLSVVNAQGMAVGLLPSGAQMVGSPSAGAQFPVQPSSGVQISTRPSFGLQVAWSEAFPQAFAQRRGYDLLRYLPVLAGVPLETKARSRQVGKDIAQAMVELEQEVFYPALQACAHALKVDLVVLNGEKLPAGCLPSYAGGDFILLPEEAAAVGSKICSNDSLTVSSGALLVSSDSLSISSGALSASSDSLTASSGALSVASDSLTASSGTLSAASGSSGMGAKADQGQEVAERLPLRIKEWTLQFPGLRRSVVRSSLGDWREDDDAAIRRFTGAAVYRALFLWRPAEKLEGRIVLRLGRVAQVAQVRVNSLVCGPTLWSEPYEVDVTDALSSGPNTIEVEVMALVRPLPLVEPTDSITSAQPASSLSEGNLPSSDRLSSALPVYDSLGKIVVDPASAPAGWLGPCEFWHYSIKKSAKSLQNSK